jgi:predicted transcriptional regulator
MEGDIIESTPKKRLRMDSTPACSKNLMVDYSSPEKLKEEMSDYSQKNYMEEWFKEMQKVCEMMGAKLLDKVLRNYLDSAEMELENEDMITLIGMLLKGITELPDIFQVEEFCGPESVIQKLAEGQWIELRLFAENAKLYEALSCFKALKSLKK